MSACCVVCGVSVCVCVCGVRICVFGGFALCVVMC